MDTRVSTRTRFSLLPILVALLLNLAVGPLGPILGQALDPASAAPVTLIDELGANDEPGQKDLNQLTVDYASATSVAVTFNWDETGVSGGGQTMDACTLFDTDGDFKANYSVCVITTDDPATQIATSPKIYSCDDSRVDRCPNQVLVAGPYASTCDVTSPSATDPFPTGVEGAKGGKGDDHPNDTQASCTIALSDVGGGAAVLLNVCSYPSEIPHSDPSDCVLVPRQSFLTVTKVVINDNGGSAVVADFPLFVDQTSVTSGVAIAVTAGTHTVSETSLAGYTGTISGDCSAAGSVTLAAGDNKSCTITNNDQGATLTVTKVVTNNNGGTAVVSDFPLFIDTTAVTSGTATAVTPGTHTVSETNQPGYTATFSGDCSSTGSVTIALGESKSCTITNNDNPPALHLIKQLTNNNGGTAVLADFNLTATGTGGSPTNLSGSSPVNSGASFKADTYTLGETGPAGYTGSSWTCVLTGTTTPVTVTASAVTIGLGQDVTCTISNNDDAPALHLIKQVINDNGGDALATAWTLSATGTGGSPTNLSGQSPVNSGASFKADTYTLAEASGPSGYTASSWSCVLTGTSTAVPVSSSTVTIGLGQDVTCTITNNDQAGTLIVNKVVSGGALQCPAFGFKVDGQVTATPFDTDCSNSVTVDAGTHSVFEEAVSGYTTTYANSQNANANCTSLTVANGATVTCTITNTRDTGKLEVRKSLSPTNDLGKFNLQINQVTDPNAANVGNGGSTGEETLNTGTYSVGETAGTATSLGNYASSIECRAANGAGSIVASGSGAGPLNVSVTKDSDIVCVITNTRVTVSIEKANDEGDNAAIEPGETIHYTLTVTVNNGPATGIVITDQLPTGLGNATNITDGGTYSAATNRITWNVGNLAQGIHTFEYDATVAASASGTLTNLGCVDADQNDALVCDQTSLLVQNVVITKTNASASTVVPGTAVDFTLTLDVTNGPIDNVTIVDQLPTGISNAINISDGGTYSAATNRITWNLVNVADNETLTYRATVSATASAGTLTNVATITEGPCVGGGCDDDSTVTVRVPTLVTDKVASTETITISGPNDALVATPSVVTWTVSFTLANGPVTNAVITDVIPTGFAYVAGSASNSGVFNQATNTVTWTFATLSTSGSVTFQTTVNPATISRTGPTVNTAVIDSNETAPDTGQDSVTVTVIPPVLAGNPTPTPAPLPNTATGIGLDGTPVSVPIELLVAFFIGSLGALTLASARTRSRRR